MALSDKLLQLAFGRTLPEMSYCIGIHLSATAAYVAEARVSGSKPKVEHLIKVPIPPPPPDKQGTRVTGVLNTDILADTERLAGLIKPAMAAAGKWRSEYAVVTLDHTFGILRYFVMPAVDQKFWKMAVPAEAKKYIPVQFEDLVSDFQVEPLAPGPDKRPRQGALFGVTQGRNLENVRHLLARLGVKLAGIELSPCSMSRLWEALEPAGGSPLAQIHFDQGDVHVILSERGMPIFVREIMMGPDAKVADRRKLDLTGCLDFAKKQLGAQRPSKVKLSGTNGELQGWVEALAQESQLKAEVQDTAKLLGIKPAEWGGYAAIGAGIRHLLNNRLTIDLSGAGRLDEADRRTALNIFAGTGALAAVFLALGLYRHGAAEMKNRELYRLRAKGAQVEAFQGKSKDDIERMVQELQGRSNTIAAITASSIRLTNILEQVTEDLPDQVWITQLSYMHPLEQAVGGGGAGSARSLSLNGNVIGASEAAEQDQAMKFKQGLERDERFQKAFSSVDVALSAGDSTSSGGQGSRTSFAINCVGRRGG